MSVATPLKLSHTALTTTLTTVLYTVPGSTKVVIKEIILANTSASAVAVTISAGSSTGVADRIVPATPVPANTTVVLSLNTILSAADTITGGAATGAVIGCSISGVTIV